MEFCSTLGLGTTIMMKKSVQFSQLKTKLLNGRKNFWRLWAKALGEKATNNDDESDVVAIIRTGIVMVYVITNLFIVAGVIRHWND